MSPSGDRSIAVVFGTRPEIIKLAPLIRGLDSRAVVIHTGQHFDDNMSGTFLRQLQLGDPHYHLEVGGLTRGAQIGQSVTAIDALLAELRPRAVVVQGDTNSGVGGAIAANAASIPLLHLEAGLRSFDRAMPEEHNRILIDAISDRCLAPHPTNRGTARTRGRRDRPDRCHGKHPAARRSCRCCPTDRSGCVCFTSTACNRTSSCWRQSIAPRTPTAQLG